MPANFGGDANSRPAVYNEKSTGVTPNDAGPISDLQAQQESKSALEQQLSGDQATDTHGTAINYESPPQTDEPIRVGRILLALPYIHCYKVQLTGRQGTCVATALGRTSHLPIGVKTGDVIPPNSMVLIWQPRDSAIGYILGVLPTPTMSDAFNPSDYVQQGGNSGPKKVEAYRNIVKVPKDAMGWVPQSSGRPMDGTINEYVRMSETGIGLLIDSFQAYLRVNEVCGLWLNYFDNYAKLAALSLNILSYCEHNLQYYDEGELFSLKGYPTYPWEATGTYSSGTKFSKTNAAGGVQLDKQVPFATEDVKDYAQTPVYRMTDYTGYIGQGFNRTLMKPAKDSGVRKFTDARFDKDVGLFQELVALDGSYSVRSAKQITLAKYPLIPNPRRMRQVEDALGDDLTEDNNYLFSGVFGYGDKHFVQDWSDPKADPSPDQDKAPNYLLRPAGVLDLMTHHYNWKSTHPFHYHTKDYHYPDENETQFGRVRFIRGTMSQSYANNPYRQQLKIDDRYGQVTYFNTASFFSMLEDGSIVLGDGYGSQITMTGGQIRLEAGGDVILASGSRVVTLSKEAIIRAKNSVDISSSERDVRLKAEQNLHMLGGNAGYGSVLIESKGQGTYQEFEDKIGEEVYGSGIVLLSKGGNVSTITQTVYLRAGVSKTSADASGSIIVDAGKGRGYFASYASFHSFFNRQGLGIWQPQVGESPSIGRSHLFSPGFSKIEGPLLINRTTVICKGGSLGVDDSVYAKGYIGCLKMMACYKGVMGLGDSRKGGFPAAVNAFINKFCAIDPEITKIGNLVFKLFFPDFVYKEKQPGNTKLIENMGFSYRDLTSKSETGPVYSYGHKQFFMLEMRWQQLARTGLAPGMSEGWQEKEVEYQGKQLLPWPGKRNWVDRPAFIKYQNQGGFLLFDTDGFAKERKFNLDNYQFPQFADFEQGSCDSSYKL